MILWFGWTALAFTVAAMVALLVEPALVTGGFGQGPLGLKAFVHAVTLGALATSAYLLLHRTWARLYGEATPWRPLLPAAWVLHVAGVLCLLWGFLAPSTLLAYWGGHYGVPTAVVLLLADGLVAAWRRPAGTPRHVWSHLPALGLFVAIVLGALLVMDLHRGLYGIYTPPTILLHLLAGGFLFLLPLMRIDEALFAAHGEPSAGPDLAGLLDVFAPTAAASAGVLLLAFALTGGDATGWAIPLGLALLGAVGLWLALPLPLPRPWETTAGVRRMAWLAVGLLALLTALRYLRGAGAAEMLVLANVGVLAFLFALALPEILARLALAAGQPRGLIDRTYKLQVGASVLLVLGHIARDYGGAEWVVRAGALLWLFALAGPVLYLAGRTRQGA